MLAGGQSQCSSPVVLLSSVTVTTWVWAQLSSSAVRYGCADTTIHFCYLCNTPFRRPHQACKKHAKEGHCCSMKVTQLLACDMITHGLGPVLVAQQARTKRLPGMPRIGSTSRSHVRGAQTHERNDPKHRDHQLRRPSLFLGSNPAVTLCVFPCCAAAVIAACFACEVEGVLLQQQQPPAQCSMCWCTKPTPSATTRTWQDCNLVA